MGITDNKPSFEEIYNITEQLCPASTLLMW